MSEKILLVDGHSIANRAFYGVPLLSNIQGIYTNAVFGFFNILVRVINMEHPDRIAVAFDLKEPTFRHKLDPAYKGTRSGMPQELIQQIPIIQEMLASLDIPVFTMPGYEADDILGTLGKHYAHQQGEVTILSGDRDLLQLAEDHLKILIPKTQKGGTEIESYYPKDVEAKYGAGPEGYLQMKALMGDSSDNIPGVPSIGEKTAAKIIQSFGTVEEAILHAAEVKPPKAAKNLAEFADQARHSLVLATILTDIPLTDRSIEAWNDEKLHQETWLDFLKKYEFQSLLERYTVVKTETLEVKDAEILRDSEAVQSYLGREGALTLRILPKVGMALKKQDTAGVWVPFTDAFTEDQAADALREAISSTELIGHDIKEEIRWMMEHEIIPEHVRFDTMVAAYVLVPTKDTYSEAELLRAYLNRDMASEEMILGTGAKKKSPLEIDEAGWAGYMVSVVEAIEALEQPLQEKMAMEQVLDLYRDIELPLIEVLASMEYEGIRVDGQILAEFGTYLSGEIARLQQMIYDMAGGAFNINSPKQLGQVLFEKLMLPAIKKTKTGYSTSADVLEKLKYDYPIVEAILEYRQLSKLNSTYVEGLTAFIDPRDGRIHCRFKQTVTATGRLSSTDPNLQNIPIRMELGRQLRKAFVPRSPEYSFMDADYSQIELRLLAHMSQDERMIQAYRDNMDIHRLTASQVLDLPPELITPAQRSNAKAVSFGIVYGISAFSLADDLHISQKEAARYIEKYFAQFPRVKGFLDHCVAQAKETGYGVTIYGRKRMIDELKSSNFNMRSFGERVAKNMPIQGSAADVIKIAMIKVYQRIRREQLKSRLIVQVHDELLLEVYQGEEAICRQILDEEMRGAAALAVPLDIDVHTGENWYEAK